MQTPLSKRLLRPVFLGLVLLWTLFLAAGCAGNRTVPAKTAVPSDTPKFALKSSVLTPLYDDHELSSLLFPIENNTVSLAADGFSLDLTFSEPVDFTQIQYKITMIGSDKPYTVGQSDQGDHGTDRMVNITAPNLAPGTYQLMISSQLLSTKGHPLAESITLTVHLESRTKAEFFLIDSSGLPRPLTYAECSSGLALSDTDKTFLIHFTQDIYQSSVEESIRQGLKAQSVRSSFSWLTPRQLRVTLSGLQAGSQYELVLNHAQDYRDFAIMGLCRFHADKPSDVGKIDLVSRKTVMLYQFSEERYAGLKDPFVKNQLILQAGNNRSWVFGLGTRLLTNLPSLHYDLSVSQSQLGPVWIDYETLLAFDPQSKELVLVSTTTGITTPIYTLLSEPLECSLSPDGSTLAVVTRNPEKAFHVDLLLIDMKEASSSDHEENYAKGYVTEDGLLTVNLTWEDNYHFVYFDGDHLKRAFLTTNHSLINRSKTLQRDAQLVACLPDQASLLYRRTDLEEDNVYLLRGDEEIRLKGLDLSEPNAFCIFIDPTILVYQKGLEICRYDTDTQKNQTLGSGMLLGGSGANKTVYFMTNAEDFEKGHLS